MTSQAHPSVVILAADEYERLRSLDRQALSITELSEEPCVIRAARPSAQPATRPVAEHHPQDLGIIRPLSLPDTSPDPVP